MKLNSNITHNHAQSALDLTAEILKKTGQPTELGDPSAKSSF